MKLKALIMEGEASDKQLLCTLLETHYPDIHRCAIVDSVPAAIAAIEAERPNLVFINIELPKGSGFRLLDHFQEPDFAIIFTTHHNQHAVKAFRLSAVDYLVKPITSEDLHAAIRKAKKRIELTQSKEQYESLKNNFNKAFDKLAIPTQEGFVFLELKNIIRCEAEGNYTKFYLRDGDTQLSSRTLKVYHDLLSDLNFFRINRSYLINLKQVRRYFRQKQHSVLMSDGSELALSDSRKLEFLQRLHQ